MEKTKLNEIESMISDHPFFRDVRPYYIKMVAKGAEQVTFNADDVIFTEGDYATKFYLVQKGTVALETRLPEREPVRIQTLGAGDALGWSWFFPPYCWHFQARALEPTSTIALDATHLLVACEKNTELGYNLMKRVEQILIHRMQAMRRQLLLDQEALRAAAPAAKTQPTPKARL